MCGDGALQTEINFAAVLIRQKAVNELGEAGRGWDGLGGAGRGLPGDVKSTVQVPTTPAFYHHQEVYLLHD